MGNTSSSGYGHSFLDFFKSVGDFGSAVLGTFTQGDTSGWGKYADDMKNYGNDIAQTFTGNSYSRYGDPTPNMSFDASSGRIRSAGGSTIGSSSTAAPPLAPSAVSSNPRSAVNATYSSLGGAVPPSNLQAISDPNTKMAIASSRGIQRQSVNVSGASTDISSANAISAASSSQSSPQ